jgi:hypothetical protein
MKIITEFFFIIGISILTTMFGGVVLSKLIEWFINPKFMNMPHLNYLDCVGLMNVAGFFMTAYAVMIAKSDKTDSDTMAIILVKQFTLLFVAYPMVLGIGYFWHRIIQ